MPSVLVADALADAMRTLAKVGSAGRGDPNRLAGPLGMPPWKIRRAQREVRGWNPAWDAILPTYLETLLDTGELEVAVNRAFEGVDWAELEAAWKTFIDKQL